MRRQFAIIAAKWLGKRENREKVKRAARQFKARMERDEGVHSTRGNDADAERQPGRNNPSHDEDRSRPSGHD